MRCLAFSLVCLLYCLFSSKLCGQDQKLAEPSVRLIDFAIGYPLVNLKSGVSRRQIGTAGFTFTYHWYFGRIGIVFGPHAWFVPSSIDAKKAMIYSLGLESGLSIRAFSESYLDPTVFVLAGVDLADAGKSIKTQFTYPVGSRVGINLYRQRSRFQDSDLAFNFSVTSRYYFKPIKNVFEPLMFDFNLAFRGTF